MINIGFGNGFRKSRLFGIIFLPYWGGIQLMIICYYFSFFIDEIWLDWQDNILFILFSVLTELNLICRIWASPII